MIKTFRVIGLHGKIDHDIRLNSDLNIFTGRNGAGKTTILKLLWYMISPNLERIPEVVFNEAEVETNEFRLTIYKETKKVRICYQQYENKENSKTIEIENDDPYMAEQIEEINKKIDNLPSGSVFFPTFRRIEGGFSIGDDSLYGRYSLHGGSISEVIASYAQKMSVHQHRFIASISTEDVEQLLTRQYATISEKTNELHQELSKYISQTVGSRQKAISDKNSNKKTVKVEELIKAFNVIDQIRSKISEVDQKREQLMTPFTVLTDLIVKIFKDKGITVSQNLTFGETKKAISAKILSAGEKQMLSFLSYNAFIANSPIFIDEPELSLHGDWQRRLFATLVKQGSSNQFIVSTHSPFIYSKFPEKEIILDTDRGE